jgi:hypothetical protein
MLVQTAALEHAQDAIGINAGGTKYATEAAAIRRGSS